MEQIQQKGGIQFWSRLRTRMAISFVAVTLLIVLLLESLVVAVMLYIFTISPVTSYWALQSAENTAQIFALQAAVQAGENGLNPSTTFAPGRPSTLSLNRQSAPEDDQWFSWYVPYVEPGSPPPVHPSFALLIGPDERILASSNPDRYQVDSPAAEILPGDITLIRAALEGRPDGAVGENGVGRYASVTQTVWSRDGKPLGAVYIQAPAGGPTDNNLLPEFASVIIPSSLGWLCLMLPIGLVFGVLTTRGLVRRIERLAGATARFSDGDTSIRVPVRQADEIGQLERQFNQMAEQIVENFAQREALAEQSARREERARIEQEMQSAHYIQKSLLPSESPDIPGWQINTCYRPAREVGGDFYDFLKLPDGRIGIIIGDATGKGIPSALIMATTCAMLRAAAPSSQSPGSVLALVNNLLLQNIPSGTFTTCFYAILDPSTGRIRYANAGHNLPYLAQDGEILELRAVGMPLGLMPDQEYEEHDLTVSSGDCALFYTDGLVETHSPQGEMFGSARLQQWIRERAKVDGLIEMLYQDLLTFTGPEREQEDDITLVCLRKVV